MKNIKHVFFDLDNTLWDFRANAKLALARMYDNHQLENKYGFSFEEFHPFYHESNESVWADFRDKKITKKELRDKRFKNAFKNLGINDEQLALTFEEEYMETITDFNLVVDGAENLLQYLKDKYAIHVITNGFEEVSIRKVEGCMIKDYIQTLTFSDELNVQKPDPRIYRHALDKANAETQESIYIGDDWIADIFGATQFGMKAVYFNPLNEEYEKIENSQSIGHLSELKSIL